MKATATQLSDLGEEFQKSKITKAFAPYEFFLEGVDAEDINANGRATVQLKISLADSTILMDQAEKNRIALNAKHTEILADLYKKGTELQKIIEVAAVKLGIDVKTGGWQFDPAKLRLFR